MRFRFRCLLAILILQWLCPTALPARTPAPSGDADRDSLKFEALGRKIDEYCLALSGEPIAVQESECDFLIESTTDSLVRQYVATQLYGRYATSRLMGAESVAIHILDKWFIPGKVRFEDEIEFLNARIFADFNRSSLIGMKASPITLRDRTGEQVGLFGPDVRPGFQVLFFYDTECSKCKVETILLRSMLESEDFPVRFHAVYTGTDREQWESYIDRKFHMEPVSATVQHLWDPDGDSDFQHLFGVLQTPRLFLIAPDNTIIGRSLDAKSLSFMLQGIFTQKELDYGSDEAFSLFDMILAENGRPSQDDVAGLADHIASSTLPKGDTVMFRQMSGDLLYYLASKPEEGCREGMKYLIDNNIVSKPEVWKTPDDSLKIIGLAQMMRDLLSKADVGARVADIKVPAQLLRWNGNTSGRWRLPRLGADRNIIIFHTDGCPVCAAQKAAAESILAQARSADKVLRKEARSTRVLLVDMDEIISSYGALASQLMDSFDLSTLPFILITDRHGVIMRRYVSLTD
ncbi:MAG: hypothetical protein ACI3ZL_00990 [Candidatus Cryptobacteroides sp.]